jgi:hypothetical protein
MGLATERPRIAATGAKAMNPGKHATFIKRASELVEESSSRADACCSRGRYRFWGCGFSRRAAHWGLARIAA